MLGENGLRQVTLGLRKLVVSLLELKHHEFIEYLVGNLVELRPMSSCSWRQFLESV